MENFMKIDEEIINSPFLNKKCYDLDISDEQLELECKKIADDIIKEELTLVDFTIYLESLLTAKNALNRKRGTWLLSTVLSYLPENLLTENELNVLVKFYFDRINEHYIIVPAVIKGVLSIIVMTNLPKKSTANLLNQIFLHVRFETCTQIERMTIYKLLHKCLTLRSDEIKEMGLHFVNGVVQATNGERDPKNLLYLFSWLPVFYRTVEMSHLLEDCFEIVGCYFPVDVRTNPREQQTITREDLVDGLASCLCAVPEFGQYCFPLVLEKLDSDLKNAIIDSADILIRGCNVFPKQLYHDNFFDVWNLIKHHILKNNQIEIKRKCLEALAAILDVVINSSEQIKKETIREMFNKFDSEIKTYILISSDNFQNIIDILLVIAKTNSELCDQIINSYVPSLLNQYYLSNDYSEEVKILNTIIDLVSVSLNFFKTLQNNNHLKSVPRMFLNSLNHKEPEMRSCGWHGFTVIVQDLPIDMRQEFIQVLLNSILNENHQTVRNDLNNFLKKFTKFADDLNNLTINDDYYNLTDISKLNNFLNSLIAISSVTNHIQSILLKIRNYCFCGDIEKRITFLNSYNDIIVNYKNHTDSSFDLYDCIEHFVISNLEYCKTSFEFNTEFIRLSSLLLFNLLKSVQFNEEIISKYLRILYFENKLTLTEKRDCEIITYLTYGLIIGVRRNYVFSNRQHLINVILNTSLTAEKLIVSELAAKIVANIINKLEDIKLESYLNMVETKINESINNIVSEENINTLLIWITKALFMRNSSLANSWLEKIFNRLKIVKSLAKYFIILLHDDKEVLCAENDCQIRILYRQKLFIECLKMIKNFKDKENEIQYSTALLNLIIYLPDELLMIYFDEVRDTLIRCLDSNVTFLTLMALRKIEHISLNNKQLIINYVSDLIPILLKLASNNSSMDIRYSALKCLEYFSQYPVYILTPFKPKVVYNLLHCLDDSKRMVRLQAIKTRLCWFKVGENN